MRRCARPGVRGKPRSPVEVLSQATSLSEISEIYHLSNRTVRSAYIVIGIVPILALYPFLQRYFIKGIVIGSVKG